MSEQLQLRRGTAAQIAVFTGAAGEVVIDTDRNRLVVQDGATAGGWAAATAKRTAVADAAYSAVAADRIVAMTALTAARVVTLPSAASFPAGERLLVIDESGACSTTNTITVTAASSQTISGSGVSPGAIAINVANGFLTLESNGSTGWTVIESFLAASAPNGAAMQFAVLETLVTLSGTSTTAGISIPANCILFSVGARVVTAITGATSFSVGDSGAGDSGASTSRFGSGLAIAAGSTNFGLIGPTAIYSACSLVVTAAGGSFSGGQVRLSIHLATCTPSAS